MEQGGIGERVGFDGLDLLVDFFAQIRVALFQHPRLELRETDVAAHVQLVGIFLLKLKGNEAVDSKQQVALAMTVKGYKPELHSQQLVDFGDLLVGQTKTIDVELTKSG